VTEAHLASPFAQGANGQQQTAGISEGSGLPPDNQFAGPGAPPGPESPDPATYYDQPVGNPESGYGGELRIRTTGYSNDFASTGKNPGDPAYGIASTGLPTRTGAVAADPHYYPPGTRVFVPGYGRNGWGTVIDVGGAIKGPYRLDLWFSSEQQALSWGVRSVPVRFWLPAATAPRGSAFISYW
jgi:3D (Asp-Asp-Asp) domain-containing protein